MGEEYTKEELESMTPAELCEIAIDLGILNLDDLVDDIWDMRGKD